MKLPMALTVLLRVLGMPSDAKQEWLCFNYNHFADERWPGTTAPLGNTPGVKNGRIMAEYVVS
jgi:hypothetical protein